MKKMTVYHGSYVSVEMPDLDKCEDGKDFGKGFYVTTSKAQAERFCKSAVGKAIEFTNADAMWLKCVSAHRKRDLLPNEIEKWRQYEIITGKIANDTTNRIITNYINGDYGDPNTDDAINFAISLLKTNKLSDQECFRSLKAIKYLHFVESYEVKF